MKNNRKTKIVCTIGPASRDSGKIEALIEAGMNVARLNFSHGSQDEHRENIQRIRDISARMGEPVAILQDLAGPKIRIGTVLKEPAKLESGNEFVLTSRKVPGDSKEVTVNYRNLPNEVLQDDTLLLADGTIELKVKSVNLESGDIVCLVVVGGEGDVIVAVLPGETYYWKIEARDRADALTWSSETFTFSTNPPTCCVLRGNVDGSGAVNVSDLTYLVTFLFQGGSLPPCEEESDIDYSGEVNVSDLTYLVGYLFQGGPNPPACPS